MMRMMKKHPSKLTQVALAPVFILSVVSLFMTGCQHSGNYDLPASHIPEPAGTRSNVAFQMQASKAEQYKYVIAANNWYSDSVTLSPRGQQKLEWIAQNIEKNPFMVYVEPSGDVRLDDHRLASLIHYLTIQGIGEPENFVIIANAPTSAVLMEELTDGTQPYN